MSSREDSPPHSSQAASADEASERASGEPPEEPESARVSTASRSEGGALRFVFYAVWIFGVPLALALGCVWVLTPPAGGPPASALREFVHDQPIPAGIVLYTLLAMVAWRFRHELPLAAAIGIGGRKDVPGPTRARFEDAAALLEEAQRILRTRRRDVERELTPGERDQLTQALGALERAMTAERFDPPEFDAAHARADRAVGEHLTRWRKGEMREYAESIGIAVAVALLLRAFVVEAFKIPSGSMIPTLMIGDHIFVNKFTYGPLIPWTDKRVFGRLPPARADVMVFKYPENKEQDFIKRVIAIPGDKLEALDGRPIINGWIVPHCHAGQFHNEGRTSELYVEFLGDKAFLTLFDQPTTEKACSTNDECDAGLSCHAGYCGVYQGPFFAGPDEVWVMGDNRNNSHDSRTWRGGLGAGVPFENIKGRAMFVWMSFGPGGGIAEDRLFVNVLGKPKLPAGQDPALQAGVDRCMKERPPLAESTPPHRP
ncbi:MAG TPA: signal peptidase I [Minicystis sp.]|nr:signal peptidase I [Minicystis sp.]